VTTITAQNIIDIPRKKYYNLTLGSQIGFRNSCFLLIFTAIVYGISIFSDIPNLHILVSAGTSGILFFCVFVATPFFEGKYSDEMDLHDTLFSLSLLAVGIGVMFIPENACG